MLKSKILILSIAFSLCLMVSLMGCATIEEGARAIAGVSTRAVEKGRKTAIGKTVNQDYFTCYTKILEMLKQTDAYVYSRDVKKKMIAFYVSQSNTTPVGVFFKEIDAKNTQIEVSSPSTYAKEYFSAKVFKELQ